MRPLVFFVLAFIFGLLTSRAVEPSYSSVIVFLLIAVALLTSATIKGGKVRGVLAAPAFFALGLLYLLPSLALYDSPDNIRNILDAYRSESIRPVSVRIEGVVSGALEARGEGVRLYIDLSGVDTGTRWQRAEGLVQITTRVKSERIAMLGRGDTVRAFVRLKHPKNFGNPGGFDYEWWLRARGVSMTGYLEPGRIAKLRGGSPTLMRTMDRYRTELAAFIDGGGLKHAGILKALTIGEKGTIPEGEMEAFRSSGTAHLLAISGLHIGFVAFASYLLIFWILRRSSRLMLAIDVKRTAVVASFLPVLSYGLISGFSVSTQRAVIMIGAYVITVAICRVRDLYSTLALAALIVLLINPASLWEVGFQLSFTAVLAIVYLISKSREIGSGVLGNKIESYRVRRVLRTVKDFTLVTVAASLATAPVMALHFHRVTQVGFIANLIIVPLATFIVVPLGLLSVIAYPISRGLSLWLMHGADRVIGLVCSLAGYFSSVGWAYSWVSTPTALELVAYYLVFVALPLFFLKANRRRGEVILALAFFCLLLSYGDGKYSSVDTSQMSVTFLSVGQGDAALVEFPGGSDGGRKRMLVDGGGFSSSSFDSGRDIIAPYLWRRKIKKIDYLVLSHPQRDHMKGLTFIADNFSPEEFWWSGVGELSEELSSTLKRNETKLIELGLESADMEIDGVRIEYLHPPRAYAASVAPDINDSSLVMRLVLGRRAVLFTGDVAEAGERLLTKTGERLRADVLKVPHHGSRYSSSDKFIGLALPEAAIISLGRGNSFGFPHRETIKRYKDRGVDIFRTDTGGAITVETDGEALRVRRHLTD